MIGARRRFESVGPIGCGSGGDFVGIYARAGQQATQLMDGLYTVHDIPERVCNDHPSISLRRICCWHILTPPNGWRQNNQALVG
eukprot:scaffold11168_cov20-Prasinocladus_malaysianus.AAC.1